MKCCIETFKSSFEPSVLGVFFVEKAELISVAESDLLDLCKTVLLTVTPFTHDAGEGNFIFF